MLKRQSSDRPGVEEEQKQTIQTLDGTILQLKETIQEQQARPEDLKSPHLGRNMVCFRS